MTRRLNWILLALIVIVGVPYYWLLIDNRPGDARPGPVTIERLRSLAAALPGAAPQAVELELIAYRRLPGNLFAAGTGMKRRLIGVMAWRLPVPGQGPIVIDTGMDAAAARAMGMEEHDPAAWRRTVAAMGEAAQIIVTHEHADHLGGVVGLGDAGLLQKVRFNRSQLPGNAWTDQLRWPAGKLPPPAISGTDPVAAAPGVVVIPAPSHTAGSQMVFVRLADGREYLFAGDIATMAANWQQLRARSRLVGDFLAPEDRGQVYAWLKTIRALKAAAPGLVILPGHDFEWVIDPLNTAAVRHGFSVRG